MTTRRFDIVRSMIQPGAVNAETMREFATVCSKRAREAWQASKDAPSVDSFRDAHRLCTLAARALRRASTKWPDLEKAMIEESILFDEVASGLAARLVRAE